MCVYASHLCKEINNLQLVLSILCLTTPIKLGYALNYYSLYITSKIFYIGHKLFQQLHHYNLKFI